MWGETFCLSPFSMTLPFFGALVAEDLAQVGLSFGPGLGSATEKAGLAKGPLFLKIDCCLTSRAVCTSP